jgi:hypothetical protein
VIQVRETHAVDENRVTAPAPSALLLSAEERACLVRHLFVLGASPNTEVLIGDDPSHHRRVGHGDWLAMA